MQEIARLAGADEEEIAAFLLTRDFPLVEGGTVTFLYHGDADAVRLRHWIAGLGAAQPFERVDGTDLWVLRVDLPLASRIEYKLEVETDEGGALVLDPFNATVAHDPYGSNSVIHTDGYVVPEWTMPDPDAREGEMMEHRVESAAFGEERTILLYRPARFRPTRRYPLLVVHDGQDYLRFSSLKTVLDNLIHRGEIAPLIVALTQANERLVEYADDPRHAAFLVEDLLPDLERELPLLPGALARGLLGASFGAVASLSAAWRRPGVFGNLLLQSGSFVFTDIGEHRHGPTFDPVVKFMNAFREAPGRPAERVAVTCGTYEGMIYYNRSVVPLLQTTGMAVRYTEARDGHNWENWRDRLRETLSWLFPGPLWMVYE